MKIFHSKIFVQHQDKKVRKIIFQLGDNFFFSCSPGFTAGTAEKQLERKENIVNHFLIKR